jgi:hypothetical protein
MKPMERASSTERDCSLKILCNLIYCLLGATPVARQTSSLFVCEGARTEAKKADPEGRIVLCNGAMTIPDNVKVFVLHGCGEPWQSVFLPMRVHAWKSISSDGSSMSTGAKKPRSNSGTDVGVCSRPVQKMTNPNVCVCDVCTQDKDQYLSERILSVCIEHPRKPSRCKSSVILYVAFLAMQRA